MNIGSTRISAFALLSIMAGLFGCATTAPDEELAGSSWAQASRLTLDAPAGLRAGWKHQLLPGKAAVLFTPVRHDGRDALLATAKSAASVVRQRVRIEPAKLGGLRFSWKVPELIAASDLARRDFDDSPVRVMLVFEGDRTRFSAQDAMLSELMLTLTGESMPYATLMYVWCNQRASGTVIRSPRTDRIRKLVLESGGDRLNRWLDYERDIRADYENVFGEPPGALVGIAIMTDSDNTRSTARAWYGPVRHVSAADALLR